MQNVEKFTRHSTSILLAKATVIHDGWEMLKFGPSFSTAVSNVPHRRSQNALVDAHLSSRIRLEGQEYNWVFPVSNQSCGLGYESCFVNNHTTNNNRLE